MAENGKKITAKGKRAGATVTVECVQSNGKGIVKVLLNGKEDVRTELFLHGKIFDLSLLPHAGLPRDNIFSILSYATVLYHYYFDEPPVIEVTDGVDTWDYSLEGESPDNVVY